MEFSEDELAAAQAALANKNNEPPANNEPPINNEPPPPANNDNNEPPPPPSSLTAEQIASQKAIDDAKALADAEALKNNPPPTPSFDEQLEKYLEEKTGGKFKKFEEIKTVLDAPAEVLDEEILHYKKLKESGIKLDKEFFELQSLDVDNMTDPEEIVLQAMRRKPEFKNLSDRALKFKINEKYNVNEWIEKDDADLTEADIVNKEIMMSDAQNDLEFLDKYKKERAFINPANEEQQKQQAEEFRQNVSKFEKMVDDDLFAKVTSLTTEVQIDKDSKENFEYKISEQVRSDAAKMMKLLPLGLEVLVNQFAEKDAEGKMKINDRKVYEMLIKHKTYDEAVQNAYKDGMAQGAKGFVKNDLKNASFTPQGNPVANPAATTEAEAIALAIKASQNKLS